MILLLAILLFAAPLAAQTGENVLLVVNHYNAISRQVADYYQAKRSVPSANVCYLNTAADEEIEWTIYEERIERPVAGCLIQAGLQEKILYIAMAAGLPFKIKGSGGSLQEAEQGSVDSELALLYGKLKGAKVPRKGAVPNPFFGKRDVPFRHPQFPIYLVTRLAAYDWTDIKGMIDRSLAARNRGKFVLDLESEKTVQGNDWLRDAGTLLPDARVILEQTTKVLYNQQEVIGYASWGSNDHNRKRRWLGFQWLPGAIATEYVSTNMRTLQQPPDTWGYDSSWAGTLQGLAADLIHEGATGASGNVYEPFLVGCARPDYVLPAYFEGRNLAESFYLGMPFLSWQSVILGDPLCSLGKP